MSDGLSDKDKDALLRWRLALGPGAEKVSPQFGMKGLRGAGGQLGHTKTSTLSMLSEFAGRLIMA